MDEDDCRLYADSDRKAIVITTSFEAGSAGNILRQEELVRRYCFKNNMLPVLSVRLTGAISADAVGDDIWEIARSHQVRHVVLVKAAVVDWKVREAFEDFREKLLGVDTLSFVMDGFLYDGSCSPFKPVAGMETALRCVMSDVMTDDGGGVRVPGAPSIASQCLMEQYGVPFGCLLAMQIHLAASASATPMPRGATAAAVRDRRHSVDEARVRGARRALMYGYVDTGTYLRALADARRERERRRRRNERDDVMAVCRQLGGMRVDDDIAEDVEEGTSAGGRASSG
ncbi:hypothetical protein SB87_gp014 [Parapoxvirus red deer/HL953]|uniref:Uncharacterized protein n=1 Tax=Parapoxvirus red deer/HL953 TaxID=1579460 RepID=A0A0A7MC12_9POXV|nr:hypothetical protein SB87_gp014 [Parapoxvirus red deer/HL953]AIZ77267.1 hypothetical protein [Parapoxvirus red deer/HL953]